MVALLCIVLDDATGAWRDQKPVLVGQRDDLALNISTTAKVTLLNDRSKLPLLLSIKGRQ